MALEEQADYAAAVRDYMMTAQPFVPEFDPYSFVRTEKSSTLLTVGRTRLAPACVVVMVYRKADAGWRMVSTAAIAAPEDPAPAQMVDGRHSDSGEAYVGVAGHSRTAGILEIEHVDQPNEIVAVGAGHVFSALLVGEPDDLTHARVRLSTEGGPSRLLWGR